MEKNKWKDRLVKACQDAKTYKPFFEDTIDSLAQILETRDKVHQQYIDEGAEPTIIKYTDRSNQPNIYKNPMLIMENELHSLALTYLRDLGLTPQGLKKLNVDIVKDENSASFEDLLNDIANGS